MSNNALYRQIGDMGHYYIEIKFFQWGSFFSACIMGTLVPGTKLRLLKGL